MVQFILQQRRLNRGGLGYTASNLAFPVLGSVNCIFKLLILKQFSRMENSSCEDRSPEKTQEDASFTIISIISDMASVWSLTINSELNW